MAKLELSALSRICLAWCIGSIEELDHQVQVLVAKRNALQIKVEWQFSIMQRGRRCTATMRRYTQKTKITDY